jgi:hypothetical protein
MKINTDLTKFKKSSDLLYIGSIGRKKIRFLLCKDSSNYYFSTKEFFTDDEGKYDSYEDHWMFEIEFGDWKMDETNKKIILSPKKYKKNGAGHDVKEANLELIPII